MLETVADYAEEHFFQISQSKSNVVIFVHKKATASGSHWTKPPRQPQHAWPQASWTQMHGIVRCAQPA